jgi:hypothetical protein
MAPAAAETTAIPTSTAPSKLNPAPNIVGSTTIPRFDEIDSLLNEKVVVDNRNASARDADAIRKTRKVHIDGITKRLAMIMYLSG